MMELGKKKYDKIKKREKAKMRLNKETKRKKKKGDVLYIKNCHFL